MIASLLIILLTISGILGGDRSKIANPGEFKYIVMVWFRDEFRCGGTIIDESHIITRGACVTGLSGPDLSIISGTIDTRKSRKQSQVKSVHIHYGFKPINNMVTSDENHWVHDIAVLRLVNPMVWDSLTAAAVLLTVEYNWNLPYKCVIPGWRHSYMGHPAEALYIRWIKGQTYRHEDCNSAHVWILENENCVYWATGPLPALTHYSGNPIVHGNTVIGIIDGRKRNHLHVFLNLLPYKDFIADTIDDRKYDVSPGEGKYVVSIWDQGTFKCGGIILDASHILTTGYCVDHANQTHLQVIAGRTRVLKNDPQIQWLSVNGIELHADYDKIIYVDGPKSMKIKNNYAVLTLAAPLEWGPTIGLVPLLSTYFAPTDQLCGAFRWHNAYTVDDEELLQLVWSEEIILDAVVCQSSGIDLEANEICISTQYTRKPTDLDSSGNPVVCQGFVVGIIIPDFSRVPQFTCLRSVLSIWPLINPLDYLCS